MRRTRFETICAVLLVALTAGSLAACSVDVRGDEGRKSEVDIRTPIGDVSVRADPSKAVDTGLTVFPGAVAVKDDGHEPGSANVNIGAFGFGLSVAAAKFESSAGEDAILGFYRKDMARYGTVTECRGDVDFHGRTGPPVCQQDRSSRDVKLVTGTRDDQRIVGITPRAGGSEIALVHVQTHGTD